LLPPLRFVGHASVLVELCGLRVLTDPVLGRRVSGLRRVADPVDVEDLLPVDVVVLSHLHADHLDLPSLRRLHDATVVVPRGAQEWLRHRLPGRRVEPLSRGETLVLGDLRITGTTCAHASDRWKQLPRGPRAEPLGYLLQDDASSVYFAGDTDLHDQMGPLGEAGIDVALLPVWGWGPSLGPGHLTPSTAVDAAVLLHPRVVVPVHWGTLAPPFLARRMRTQLTEPPLVFARSLDRAGLPTRAAVLPPGTDADW
jgi:L-ascorbate metabolism protein UlaG (beta-lactamase superfamily)